MSWQEAHRYNQALRDVRADLELLLDVELVWRPEYREIFGSPERLVLALWSRWHTTLRAQIEDVVTEHGGPGGAERALAAANAGLLRALARAGAIVGAERDPSFAGAA
jgi:hypothetical protein